MRLEEKALSHCGLSVDSEWYSLLGTKRRDPSVISRANTSRVLKSRLQTKKDSDKKTIAQDDAFDVTVFQSHFSGSFCAKARGTRGDGVDFDMRGLSHRLPAAALPLCKQISP